MDKLLLFPGASERGIFTYLIDHEHQHLVKTAAEYHPTIAAYINASKPIPGKTQILLTALGAGEWWGSNVNGDYFPETALAHEGADYGYKTFEKYAKIYKHHINKDPTASYGDVPLSIYNPSYHRVELIVCLDNAKAPDIVARVESGDYPEWSMGCRVPFDVCSICGNRAPTRKEYCTHARYYMNRIDPETGKQVYVINTMPRFFDISQVLIGADKTAKTLKKVASRGGAMRSYSIPSSAYIAEKMASADLTTKKAEIEKQVPAHEPPAGAQELLEAIPVVKGYEKPLPRELLNQLGASPLPRVLSTLAMLGILPKPQEFQRIILVSIGKPAIADQLDRYNMCFDPNSISAPDAKHEQLAGVSWRNFDPELFGLLRPHLEDRSYSPPLFAKRLRVIMEKSATEEPLPDPHFIKCADEQAPPSDQRKPLGILPVLLLATGLYHVLAKKAPLESMSHLDKLIAEHPAVAAALGFGLYSAFAGGGGVRNQGHTVAPAAGDPDRASADEYIAAMQRSPIMKTAGPVTARFGAIPLLYMSSGVLQKQKESDPYRQEGPIRKMIRQYPDLLSVAAAADGLAAARGGGTHGYLKNLKKHVAGIAKAASETKEADAFDLLSNAIVWPLSFGKVGLPARVAGGLFDHALSSGARKVLSNRKKPNKLVSTPEE